MKRLMRSKMDIRARIIYLSMRAQKLDEEKHELEKVKILVDVLKHFTTVITALILILSYFGTSIIPTLSKMTIPLFGIDIWTIVVIGLSMSLGLSLIALVGSTFFPNKEVMSLSRFLLVLVLLILGFTSGWVVSGLRGLK